MGVEIERKFRVTDDRWRQSGTALFMRQGYLCSGPTRTVRVRVVGERGYLTVKGTISAREKQEFEYLIDHADAEAMLDLLCPKPLIEKWRHTLEYGGHTWEVDEFTGANQGLVIAEIELDRADQSFVRPDWVGAEVTGDPRYYNACLSTNPFSSWPRE